MCVCPNRFARMTLLHLCSVCAVFLQIPETDLYGSLSVTAGDLEEAKGGKRYATRDKGGGSKKYDLAGGDDSDE